MHCALYTTHSLHTVHYTSTLYTNTIHSPYTHCTPHTVHCTLHTYCAPQVAKDGVEDSLAYRVISCRARLQSNACTCDLSGPSALVIVRCHAVLIHSTHTLYSLYTVLILCTHALYSYCR
jgi:hypothetical protein